jgi:uncharacterized protein (DUF1697 family)
MTACAVLLRAVNVGGSGVIRMADLKALCEALGFRDVTTLLQSGNVVFEAPRLAAAAVEKKLAAALQEKFGLATAVMARTAADLAAIVAANPFAREAAGEPGKVVVLFLAGTPDSGAKARLAALKVGRERTALVGRELFVHYADGIGRSKLTNAVIEKALGGVPATGRNWNTVLKLQALVAATS